MKGRGGKKRRGERGRARGDKGAVGIGNGAEGGREARMEMKMNLDKRRIDGKEENWENE